MTDKVYIAISGNEIEYTDARDSIQLIQRRDGDSLLNFARATKGYESRQQHIDNFLDTDFDYILFLDGDQVFPRHTLERLRLHGLPFVSGFYPRRRYDVIAPVWYEPYTGELPLKPWTAPLEPDRVYQIGASGWGCILVHRDVILGVRRLLKGEWEVLEDDMDVMPYDLAAIMGAIRGLRAAVQGRANEIESHVATLEREIVPFSYSKQPVGSDIRFAVFAHLAGYPLYGDTGVDARHVVNYPLGLGDYARYHAANGERFTEQVNSGYDHERAEYAAERARVGDG
jgi:hypothetical protein